MVAATPPRGQRTDNVCVCVAISSILDRRQSRPFGIYTYIGAPARCWLFTQEEEGQVNTGVSPPLIFLLRCLPELDRDKVSAVPFPRRHPSRLLLTK